MSSDSDSEICIPPEIRKIAEIATRNLLPDKLHKKYNMAYQFFLDWSTSKNVKTWMITALACDWRYNHPSINKIIQLFVLLSILFDAGLTRTATDASCSDVGQVQFVQVFEVGSSLVVVWQEPIGSDDCSLTYKVEYSHRLNTETAITEELHYTFDYNPHPCDLGQVSITPITEDGVVENAVYVEEYAPDIGAVSNIILYQEDGLLRGTWSDPPNTDLCKFSYLIEYVDENDYSETVETDVREVTFSYNLIPCLTSNITITPRAGTKMGFSTSTIYEADVGPVENFKLISSNGEVITRFDPPSNTHLCTLSYEVAQIDTGCFTKSIDVYPVSHTEKYGMSQSGVIETEIKAVTNLNVQFNNGMVMISWAKPDNVGDCDVEYDVQFGEGDIYRTDDTSLSIAANPLPCQPSKAMVWPVSTTGNLGVLASVKYERELGPVKQLSLRSNGVQLVATWTPPTDSELCTLSYLLEFYDGTETHMSVSNDANVSFEYGSCNGAHITVTAHTASGLMGAETRVTCKEGVSELGPVGNLMVTELDDNLEITWDAPPNAVEFAEVTYLVEYFDTSVIVHDMIYAMPLYELSQCAEMEVMVTPVSESAYGMTAAVNYMREVEAVTNVEFTETHDKLKITWSEPTETTYCGDITYEIEYEDVSYRTDVPEYEVDMSSITHCVEVTYKIMPVSSISGVGKSIETTYTSNVGPVTGVTFTESNDKLKISWRVPSNAADCGDITYEIEYEDEKYYTTIPVFEVDISTITECTRVNYKITPISSLGLAATSIEETYNISCWGIQIDG